MFKRNSMVVDGEKIMPRDYRALKQYYEASKQLIENMQEETDKSRSIINDLNAKVDSLLADLRGKENEIEILKWRVEYLKQFEPKKDEVPTIQG